MRAMSGRYFFTAFETVYLAEKITERQRFENIHS